MKKILALMLVLVIALSLAACGGKTAPAPSDDSTSQQQSSNIPDNSNAPASEELFEVPELADYQIPEFAKMGIGTYGKSYEMNDNTVDLALSVVFNNVSEDGLKLYLEHLAENGGKGDRTGTEELTLNSNGGTAYYDWGNITLLYYNGKLDVTVAVADYDLLSNIENPVTNTNTEQPEKTPDTSTSATSADDDYTVAEFLAYYGMTEDDIMPEHFVEFAPVKMEDDDVKAGEVGSWGYITITVDKDATTLEDINAWFETLYAKLLALSEDGKLHNYPQYIDTENDEEVSLQALMESPLWTGFPGGSCAYPYKLSTGGKALMVATSYDIEAGQYSLSISVW